MGHHNRHFAGDRYASAGWWGKPTSTANFCEEDYAVTYSIAEFINTLTNLAYSWLHPETSAPTTASTSSSPSDAKVASARLPRPWSHPDFLSASLWVLGFFSLVFHATLQHSTQYGDEISMLILGGALMRGVLPRTPASTAVSAAAVVASSAIYLQTGQILHHVFAFDAMLLVIGARTMYLIVSQTRGTGSATDDPQLLRRRHDLLSQFGRAVTALLLGYILWNIDLEMCAQLRSVRAVIGLPLAWLLELHGWWHVLTALGASYFIRLTRDLVPEW